jgi:hypothetical protein
VPLPFNLTHHNPPSPSTRAQPWQTPYQNRNHFHRAFALTHPSLKVTTKSPQIRTQFQPTRANSPKPQRPSPYLLVSLCPCFNFETKPPLHRHTPFTFSLSLVISVPATELIINNYQNNHHNQPKSNPSPVHPIHFRRRCNHRAHALSALLCQAVNFPSRDTAAAPPCRATLCLLNRIMMHTHRTPRHRATAPSAHTIPKQQPIMPATQSLSSTQRRRRRCCLFVLSQTAALAAATRPAPAPLKHKKEMGTGMRERRKEREREG